VVLLREIRDELRSAGTSAKAKDLPLDGE